MGRCSGVARNFNRRGSVILPFLSVVFFSRANCSRLKNRKGCRGPGGMLPREKFEILHAVMTILVLFEHFSGKLCLKVLTLNTKSMMHFVCTFSIMRARGKAYCY